MRSVRSAPCPTPPPPLTVMPLQSCATWNTQWSEVFFFFSPFHFSKPLKFVLGLQKWEFSTMKKYCTLGKKSGKITVPPLKIISLTPLENAQAIIVSMLENMQATTKIHGWNAGQHEETPFWHHIYSQSGIKFRIYIDNIEMLSDFIFLRYLLCKQTTDVERSNPSYHFILSMEL